jgi:hypothetical protein
MRVGSVAVYIPGPTITYKDNDPVNPLLPPAGHRVQAIADETKINQTLCWGFARSRKRPLGGDRRRVHTNARNWMSTLSFKNENENSKDIIKQIAAEDESGVSNKNSKTTRWKMTRDDGPTTHNTTQDADERLKRQEQKSTN